MLDGIISYLKHYFSEAPPQPLFVFREIPPVWNNREHLEGRWEERSAQTIRNLGTVAQALRTIEEYEEVFSSHIERFKSGITGQEFCWDTDDLRAALGHLSKCDVVGDPTDVRRLFGKRFGYVIEWDPISGLQKEEFEGINRGLTVLRFEGRIISAYPSGIIRMESSNGVTFI